MAVPKSPKELDWKRIVYTVLASRSIDHIEETKLLPEKKVLYQFSAKGHDVSQVILGSLLNNKHDAVSAYYRSRPMLLSLGLSLDDAFASPMAKSGGFSDGRDIGVVCNLPSVGNASVFPMSGDVGSQYTPIAGWAQAMLYRKNVLKDSAYTSAIGVTLGGEASVATNGFWSALTMATTLKLPMLFYVEDNGYGISVTSDLQTPGANIAKNLASFQNLALFDGNGSEIEASTTLFLKALQHVRSHAGPALVRLQVPRLNGHSGQDTQAYKSKELIDSEKARDPLPFLKEYVLTNIMTEQEWIEIEKKVDADIQKSLQAALQRPEPSIANIKNHVFFEGTVQAMGGVAPEKVTFAKGSETPQSEPTRTNMLTTIRRTLESELKSNPRLVVFGEDIGPKGGVHGATLGLQEAFGKDRVFDTSLSEEGIIGRAVGMALAGLVPVPEIQFRKYADPATEQLNNCGTMRWRTNNRFAAPIIVRIPGGFAKCGDPWHSVSNEVMWAHSVGWKVAYPSNAEDASGLLRSALRGNDPVIFFEHRHMYDTPWARRPYPGDEFVVPFGKASITQEGSEITIVTWGAFVERCEEAAKASGFSCEIIDLRTIMPWDKESVLESVKKTRRCLIVHEDGMTAGFGAEIAATIVADGFFSLDAPVKRLAVEDIPIPYNIPLMESILPNVDTISNAIAELCEM